MYNVFVTNQNLPFRVVISNSNIVFNAELHYSDEITHVQILPMLGYMVTKKGETFSAKWQLSELLRYI